VNMGNKFSDIISDKNSIPNFSGKVQNQIKTRVNFCEREQHGGEVKAL
jgi:hypothetical protein